MRIGMRVAVCDKDFDGIFKFITMATVASKVDDSFINGHNGDECERWAFVIIGDNGKTYDTKLGTYYNYKFYQIEKLEEIKEKLLETVETLSKVIEEFY